MNSRVWKGIFVAVALLGTSQIYDQFVDHANAQESSVKVQASDLVVPEFGSVRTAKNLVQSKSTMVVTAHPAATEAGLQILRNGGNAIDAMVAVQLVLGLVEPQSSGLGGGAFLIYHDAKTGKVTTLDGRETAPAAAIADLFIAPNGEAMKFFDAVVGGKSVGVPGTVALLEDAHQRYGKLKWADLFVPAIKLAESGFKVSPRLNESVTASAESLFLFEPTRNYFLSEEGVPVFAGTNISNKPYAQTLKQIAQDGKNAFYSGQIAADIVKVIQSSEANPGIMTVKDLESYEVKERPATCFDYRSHEICGMGPPSSGALTIGQILKQVEPYDLRALGPQSAESWRLIGEASRLAFADRGRYMADSDFVSMPKGLLNKEYLAERAKLIAPVSGEAATALPASAIQPGNPPLDHAQLFADDQSIELPSTTHFTIVDEAGNIVSMTSTIENSFGSRLMVHGFMLNNEMTDFSFVPEIGGVPIANRIEAGKRPRSSMAPTIVYKDGKPWAALGSPGGSQIIGYVAKTLIALIDWDMDMQAAIDLPHLVNRFGTFEVEEKTAGELFAPALSQMGFKVKSGQMNSGLHGIRIKQDLLEGGADPRREGLALGD